ncbi:MAG: hypothetical protein U0670_07405 [Anaerolineae bacterium]
MWNRSDKMLDDCIIQALRPETPPSAALKQEIWEGLLAKVSAQAADATSTAESESTAVCLPKCSPVDEVEAVLLATPYSKTAPREGVVTRFVLSILDMLEASTLFLFSDNLSLERARTQTAPSSRLLIRGTFTYAGV